MRLAFIGVAIGIALLIFSIVGPLGVPLLQSAATTSGHSNEAFVIPTVLPTLTTIPITPVANTPVTANTQSITINLTPVAETTNYTFVDATGVATVNTDVIASGDTVRIGYSYTDSTLSVLYATVAIFAFLGMALGFYFWVKSRNA